MTSMFETNPFLAISIPILAAILGALFSRSGLSTETKAGITLGFSFLLSVLALWSVSKLDIRNLGETFWLATLGAQYIRTKLAVTALDYVQRKYGLTDKNKPPDTSTPTQPLIL